MMRSSIATHTHRVSANNNPASVHRLVEKKKEFEAVAALERASALFVRRIEGLADDCDVMADAGQVHGQVLEQWPNMFHILGLFLANRQQYAESGLGERLVRIPLDDVQVDKSTSESL